MYCVSIPTAIIVLLYEGVCGNEVEELVALKKEDINFAKNSIAVKIHNERIIPNIDGRSMNILKYAITQTIYDDANDESTAKCPTSEMVSSDYIIRPIIGNNFDGKMSREGIITRLNKFKGWTKGRGITTKSIYYSGMFEKLKSIENTHGKLTFYGLQETDSIYKYGKSKNFSQLRIKLNDFNRAMGFSETLYERKQIKSK